MPTPGMFDLSSRLALVTGGGSGLGLAMARGLGQAGARVVVSGRNVDKLERAVEALRSERVDAESMAFDVTDAPAAMAAIAEVEARRGAIDILVNSAGAQLRKPFDEVEPDEWRRIMAVNADGVMTCTLAAYRGMKARRHGKIINVASVLSELGRETVVPYAVSKGAVRQFTRGLAVEAARYNVQVNAIAPGFFATELTAALVENPAFNDWLVRRAPAGRWGDPAADLAGAVVFLASAASDYVSGHVLVVDGGMSVAL